MGLLFGSISLAYGQFKVDEYDKNTMTKGSGSKDTKQSSETKEVFGVTGTLHKLVTVVGKLEITNSSMDKEHYQCLLRFEMPGGYFHDIIFFVEITKTDKLDEYIERTCKGKTADKGKEIVIIVHKSGTIFWEVKLLPDDAKSK